MDSKLKTRFLYEYKGCKFVNRLYKINGIITTECRIYDHNQKLLSMSQQIATSDDISHILYAADMAEYYAIWDAVECVANNN